MQANRVIAIGVSIVKEKGTQGIAKNQVQIHKLKA